jgi:flagellar hook-associated protein 2
MASVSSLGVGSGLDAEGIISALMSTERRPLQLMQTEASTLSSKISVWGTISSHVSALQDAAQDLASVSIWNKLKASSSNATALTVSSDSSAAAGRHSVSISQLATGQTVSSPSVKPATTPIGAGTLTLELGSWSGNTFTGSGTSKNVTVDADDTLANIRDKINAAGAGVTASVVTDASGDRLVLRSNGTGETSGFRLSATEDADDGDPDTGLSMLGFTATDGSSPMDLAQAAQNAKLKIDGIDISSASNTVTGALEGVTLELHEATTTAAEVLVETDTAEITKSIDSFISSFNTLMGYLKTQTKYDEATKKAATLQGDSAAVGLVSQMRNLLNEEFTGGGLYSRLSDIGIEMNKDGTLKKSTTGIEDALTHLDDLEKLFGADGTGSTASQGFMQRFDDWAGRVLGTEGTVESRKGGLQATLDRNEDRQDAMETRLEQTEKRLRAQYEALDQMMAKLNGTSSYVSQMISGLG